MMCQAEGGLECRQSTMHTSEIDPELDYGGLMHGQASTLRLEDAGTTSGNLKGTIIICGLPHSSLESYLNKYIIKYFLH
jgi:hypothetical protein